MSTRVELIRGLLEREFEPTVLEISDDSHRHAGHAGAAGGGHFRVRIVSRAFAGKPPLTRHRMVYAALGDAMKSEIHALTIDANHPEES